MKPKPTKADNHWSISPCGKGLVVSNRNKGFDNSHTHVKNMSAANALIKVARLKVLPRHWHIRMLTSLARIADDDHAEQINQLIAEKKHKGKQRYNNRRCG